MKKLKEIDNINGFIVDELEVIWVGDKLYLNSDIITEGDIQLIRQKEGNIYVQKPNSSELIESSSLSKYSLSNIGDLIQKEILLHGKYNETYTKRKIIAEHFKTQEILWEKDDGIGTIYWEGEHLFGNLNSTITKYHQQDGSKIWDLNLGILGKYSINGELKIMNIQKIIGVFNECLYVKAGTQILLGINIYTGNIEFESRYKEDFLVLDNLKIDELKNCIFSIGPRHYIEFNLDDATYKLFSHAEQTIDFGIETTRLGGWETNDIYFWEGSTNNKFGQFSRELKTINWTKSIDEVEGKFPAIKELKYGLGKLYINDHNNRLHVYRLNEYAS